MIRNAHEGRWLSANNAFSLAEMLIVIAILGIMAAIVMPSFQDHSRKAREAAAKDNLRILRTAIEMYAAQHNSVAPGYAGNNPAGIPSGVIFKLQVVPDYLQSIPENPFNALDTVTAIQNGVALPAAPTGASGWIYKPAEKTFKIDTPGTDSEGVDYYDY